MGGGFGPTRACFGFAGGTESRLLAHHVAPAGRPTHGRVGPRGEVAWHGVLGTREGDPMSTDDFTPFTREELAAEGVTALPDKEVVTILDLAADIDLAIDGAAPIDLAIA